MDKLTAAEQAIAENAAQDLYRYEKTCEEHMSVLRKDPEGLAKAYKEYEAQSNKIGFMPPRNEFDDYIKESEKVLGKECTSFIDHIHVVNTSHILSRLLMSKVSEQGEKVYLEFIGRKVALDKKYSYAFPETPATSVQTASNESRAPDYPIALSETPASVQMGSDESWTPEYPIVLPGPPFESDSVVNLHRISIHEIEYTLYEQEPERLQKETFVFLNDDSEDEFYRVSAILTTATEKLYYLVSADQGAEAVAWSATDFLDLLRKSQRVIT